MTIPYNYTPPFSQDHAASLPILRVAIHDKVHPVLNVWYRQLGYGSIQTIKVNSTDYHNFSNPRSLASLLVSGKADVYGSDVILMPHYDLSNFTYPLYYSHLSVYVSRNRVFPEQSTAFCAITDSAMFLRNPFKHWVWFASVVAILLCVGLVYLPSFRRSKALKRRKIRASFVVVAGKRHQRGSKFSAFAFLVCATTIGYVALLYSSNLKAFALRVRHERSGWHIDFEGIAKEMRLGKMQMVLDRLDDNRMILINQSTIPRIAALRDALKVAPPLIVDTTREACEIVANQPNVSKIYAFLQHDEKMNRVCPDLKKKIEFLLFPHKQSFMSAFVFSPHAAKARRKLTKLIFAGILWFDEQYYNPMARRLFRSNTGEFRETGKHRRYIRKNNFIKYRDLALIFFLLFVGYVVAVMLFAAEVVVCFYCNRRATSSQIMTMMSQPVRPVRRLRRFDFMEIEETSV